MRLPYRNLALTPSIRRWVETEFVSQLQTTRDDRIVREERWMRFTKMNNVELEESYVGRSQVYFAAVHNLVATWKDQIRAGLYPNGDWFDIKAQHNFGFDANALAQKALQRKMIQHMKLKQAFDEWAEQLIVTGNGIYHHGFADEEEMQRYYERVSAGMPLDEDATLIFEEEPDEEDALSFRSSQGQKYRLVEKMVRTKYGPVIRPVDVFHFHVGPSTARNIQDAELVFEDMVVTLDYLEQMHAELMDPRHKQFGHIFENIDEILSTDGGRQPLATMDADLQRRSREGQEQDANVVMGDLDSGYVNMSNCFWRGEIPGAKDPDTKKSYGVRDWQITVINDKWPVRIHPNPRYRNRRPWHHGRIVKCINEIWARGLVEPVASIQLMMNDLGNLTLDNLILALNPIALIDAEKVQNFDSLQMSPAAKWFLEGPMNEAVQFVNPPNVVQLGQAILGTMQSYVQDYGRANFIAQGQPAPAGRGRSQNTAGGMAMIAGAGQGAVVAVLDDLQEDVQVPILESNYEMQEQFMSDRMLIQIGGSDGVPLIQREVGFEDVVGDYVFLWKGAQMVREQGQMIQGLQGLMQWLGQLKQVDPEAAASFRVKWPVFIKRLLTDAYGLSWADEIIETADDQKVIDPYLELDLMSAGRTVPVSPMDDDDQHLMVQIPAGANDERFQSEPEATNLREHIMAHVAQKQMKAAAAQQRAIDQAMQMAGGEVGPAGGGAPSPPGISGPASGGPGQASAAALSAGAQMGG